MKTQVDTRKRLGRCWMLVAGMAAVLAAATTASAQVAHPIEFTTSFSFTAGDTTFPAGMYTIRPVDNEPDLVEVSGHDVAAFVPVLIEGIKRNEPAKDEIIFNRYGKDAEVLNQIWDAVDNTGIQAVKSRAELRNEKKFGKAMPHSVPSKRQK